MTRRSSAVVLALGILACASCDTDSGPTNPGPRPPKLDSPPFGNGQSYVSVFDSVGTFPYHCGIHPVMTGTITCSVVTGADSIVVNIVNSSSTGFQPGTATVKKGGYVRWSNQSTSHSIESD